MLLPRTLSIHRRSIVLTWLLSYLAVLLLPIMLSVIVYRESSATLEGEIHQANHSLLKQVREVTDNYFLSVERLNFELTWNLQMQELLNSNKYASSPNEYIYDRYKLTQDFNLYQSAYPTVDLFYTYLGGDNTVLLPGTVREGPFAYRTLHSDPSFPYEEWHSLINRKNFRGFVPMVRIDENLKIRKTVAYVSSYNTDKDGTLATNVVMIDQARILGAIENVELFNKGHVLILNRDNEPLVSNSNDKLPADFPYDQLGDESKFFYYKKDGEKYEIHSIRSERVGLTYVSMIPSSLYWEKAQHVRNLTYVSILISLSGGSLLTYVFLRRNYNPVRRLVETFSGKSNVSYGKEHNEFQFLEQAIGTTLSEMDKIMDRMKSQQHILRSNFIARLLKGRIDSQIPVDESLITFNMRPISSDFAVIMLYVEASAPFHERLDGMESGDKQRLLQFIVSNVVEELAGRKHRGYMAEVDHALACLINVSDSQDAGSRMDDLLHIAKEAQSFLNTHYHLHLTLSISSIHSGIENIAKAYLEALDAMEYKLVMGGGEILSYEQIYKAGADESEPAAYYYPLQVEQQLINYVKIGDFQRSKETLSGIIERNLSRPVVSIAIARCLMLDLVSTMMKTVSEIGDGQEHFLQQNTKRIERLSACETLQEMQQQMTALLQNVCDYTSAKRQQNIQQSRQQAISELSERITAFIHEHYRDPNLNITMIGHHFEMKPTYLSRLFKDHTGEGLLDFINKVRIDKAKQLLEGGKKSITDASGLVGFNDVNAFIRTFKKYEGITPGKYKELLEE